MPVRWPMAAEAWPRSTKVPTFPAVLFPLNLTPLTHTQPAHSTSSPPISLPGTEIMADSTTTTLSAAPAATVYRLVFTVPESHVAACKAAIFAAGAGIYPNSNYTECCWTTEGTGQFRPGDAARPHLGIVGQVETVREVRVETPCVGKEVARRTVEALKGYVWSAILRICKVACESCLEKVLVD